METAVVQVTIEFQWSDGIYTRHSEMVKVQAWSKENFILRAKNKIMDDMYIADGIKLVSWRCIEQKVVAWA